MASLFRPLNRCLVALRSVNNSASVMQQRLASTNKPPYPPPVEGSINKPLEKNPVDETADPKESYLANPWDLLYGAEKFEVAMKAKGILDPYDMEPVKRKAVSSAADPNVVPTLGESRVVACVCEPDTHHINFMWISKGETSRCECGHWFKCVEREMPDLSEFGIHYEKHAHH